MKITYNGNAFALEDEMLDVGYSAEKVELLTKDDKKVTVGGHTGRTQILVSLPFVDDATKKDLATIDAMLNEVAKSQIDAWVVSADKDVSVDDGFFKSGVDYDEAFGDYYGTRLLGGELDGKLTKTLFIIAQDGTLFYIDAPQDLADSFNMERFQRQIVTALSCCDKKGCHE